MRDPVSSGRERGRKRQGVEGGCRREAFASVAEGEMIEGRRQAEAGRCRA